MFDGYSVAGLLFCQYDEKGGLFVYVDRFAGTAAGADGRSACEVQRISKAVQAAQPGQGTTVATELHYSQGGAAGC